MKRIKIKEPSLAIREVIPVFADGFKAIKLSSEQAMRFTFEDETANFEQLSAKYGQHNILKEDELHTGYIILCNPISNQLISMFGKIRRIQCANGMDIAPLSVKQAYKRGTLYEVYMESDKKKYLGSFRYVWPFGSTPFEKVTTEEKAVVLRKKLVNGAISRQTFEISDEENDILLKYLGKEYYDKFFIVYD